MTANVVHVQNFVQKIGGNTVAQVDNAYYIMIVIKYYYCIYYCIYSMLLCMCYYQLSTTNSNMPSVCKFSSY